MSQDQAQVQLNVTVIHVVFASDDGGFSVVRAHDMDQDEQLTAAGLLPAHLEVGDLLLLDGHFEDHPKFGKRFKVSRAQPRMPQSVAGIRNYLSSARLKGIGPALAKRLVDAFGDKTLEVLENEPERILDVPGVGRQRQEEIVRVFSEGRAERESLAFLQGMDLGPAMARNIWTKLGSDTLGTVRKNPFQLCQVVEGLGFKTADRIAASLGWGKTSLQRQAAGLDHVLKEALKQGHLCLPAGDLVERASQTLELPAINLRSVVNAAVGRSALHSILPDLPSYAEVGAPRVYLPVILKAEAECARLLLALSEVPMASEHTQLTLTEAQARSGGIVLSDEQRDAVNVLLGSKVSLLTGGPGVGKTTVMRAAVNAWRNAGLSVALASPTGRAAKRLGEATDSEAKTLHRMFQLVPGVNTANKSKEFIDSVLVIDETSMLDLPTFLRVLKRIPPHTILVLVGDPDQLPSVGPGAVLQDILQSRRIPAARLETVFRQAAGSDIVANAHRIVQGHDPQFRRDAQDSDCFFVAREDPALGAEMVERLFLERMPQRYGLDPRKDIQVLSPMHRGDAGVDALNARLSQALNGGSAELKRGYKTFRVGDRVIQTSNDYDLGLMNGDLGVVGTVNPESRSLVVTFDGKRVEFKDAQVDKLDLAFAITVHKSQGGEFPAVILPLFGEHFLMLKRNLLYTAVTRARRLLVIVGSPKALRKAVSDDRQMRRYGCFQERLQGLGMRNEIPFPGAALPGIES